MSNFIFTVVMKVQVKPSVFANKFQLFDIGCLLHLKHKHHIDAASQILYKGLMGTLVQQPLSLSNRTFLLTESYSCHCYLLVSYTIQHGYIQSIQQKKLQWFQYFKLGFHKIPDVTIQSVFQNQVTYCCQLSIDDKFSREKVLQFL